MVGRCRRGWLWRGNVRGEQPTLGVPRTISRRTGPSETARRLDRMVCYSDKLSLSAGSPSLLFEHRPKACEPKRLLRSTNSVSGVDRLRGASMRKQRVRRRAGRAEATSPFGASRRAGTGGFEATDLVRCRGATILARRMRSKAGRRSVGRWLRRPIRPTATWRARSLRSCKRCKARQPVPRPIEPSRRSGTRFQEKWM